MARISVSAAKELADQWKAQHKDFEHQPHAGYFRDASPHDLIKMWETRKRKDGRKLNDWEFACFVEAWVKCFGDLPADAVTEPKQPRADAPAIPADDTMLRMPDLLRLTGLSISTVKRMVQDGRFPKPVRLGVRAKGWPASDVRAFMKMLDEQRKGPRQ